MREVRWERMRPHQIVDEKQRFPVVYLPIAPIEWHSYHLPMGMDPMRACEVSLRLARNIGGIVLPPIYWGTDSKRSPEMLKSIGFKGNEDVTGMDFPNNTVPSLYCKERVLKSFIKEAIRVLKKQGFKVIAIINGHGGENHVAVLKELADKMSTKTCKVLFNFVTVAREDGDWDWGHASAEETSVMMAMAPELVDLGRLPDRSQPLHNVDFAIVDDQTFRLNPTKDHTPRDDPRIMASPQLGEANLKGTVQQIAERIRNELG